MEYGNGHTRIEQELRELTELNSFMRMHIMLEYAQWNMDGNEFAEYCLKSWRGHADYDSYASEKFEKFQKGNLNFAGESYEGFCKGIIAWYHGRIAPLKKEVK